MSQKDKHNNGEPMNDYIEYFKVNNRLFCVESRYLTTFMYKNGWDFSELGYLELERSEKMKNITSDEAMEITGGATPIDIIERIYVMLGEPEEIKPEAER